MVIVDSQRQSVKSLKEGFIMEILLKDILIIFALSMVVLFVCHRLRVPTIVGFLLTGLLLGPHGLGLITADKEVIVLAEIGVVMLLFTIGIEFSLKDLIRIKRAVLMGGSLQVLLTLAATFLFARHFAYGLGESVFAGFLVALSSTAIVLKLLQDRAEIESPHGQTTLGILIYQDIIIVPMILLTPLLAGKAGAFSTSLPLLLAKAIGIIVLVILSAEYIVPKLLYQIARTRSRELFLLSIVVMCLAVAWLTHSLKLSLALGAFLAGLTISESDYSHQALSSVLPFRDLFTSFFFISIGMLLDIHFLFEKPGLVFLLALGVLLSKSLLGMVTTLLLGLPMRTAILVGLGICQVGEFSFVLAEEGVKYALLGGDIFQLFLAVSVLTMAATPFIIILGDGITGAVMRLPLPKKVKSGLYPLQGLTDARKKVNLKGHVIVVGFGFNGKNVTRAARLAGVPYIIIEMNPETVRIEKEKGEPIYYGDAGQEAVLKHANIREARIIVLVISDPAATRKIALTARHLNPGVHIIARTRFLQEMEPLYELGVNEVIPEEFETSVEIFSRVLTRYLIPRDEIDRFVTEVRSDGYEMFRRLPHDGTTFCDLQSYIPDVQINTVRVGGASPFVGKTLSEVELRKKYGVTLLAIRRDKEILSNPGGDTKIEANDIWVILAQLDRLAQMTTVLS
jgi:CPA2 family monovalent cation:H+ antiporter-2